MLRGFSVLLTLLFPLEPAPAPTRNKDIALSNAAKPAMECDSDHRCPVFHVREMGRTK
jgi:hypothetical protein